MKRVHWVPNHMVTSAIKWEVNLVSLINGRLTFKTTGSKDHSLNSPYLIGRILGVNYLNVWHYYLLVV